MGRGRKVEFIGNGGKPLSVSPAEIVACVMRHTSIDPRYFLGTAQHEVIDFATNEVDTEPPKLDKNGKELPPYVSSGVWQVGVEEATSVGMHDADLLDLEESTIVFCKVTEKRYGLIYAAAKVSTLSLAPPPGINAYFSVAHNQGLAAALKTIALHGLDWVGYKMRNLQAAQNAVDAANKVAWVGSSSKVALDAATAKLAWWKNVASYGDDCISGGERWSDLLLGPRPNV